MMVPCLHDQMIFYAALSAILYARAHAIDARSYSKGGL